MQPVVAAASAESIVAVLALEPVVSEAAVEPVVAQSTSQQVVSESAVDVVVAGSSVELIPAAVAREHIVAGFAPDPVVAESSCGVVVAGSGEQPVVAEVTEEPVVAVAAQEQVVAEMSSHGVVAFTADDHVRVGVAVEGIVAVSAKHQVTAGSTGDHVVAVLSIEPVVARTALDDIIALATVDQHVDGDGRLDLHHVIADARVDDDRALGVDSLRDRVALAADQVGHAAVEEGIDLDLGHSATKIRQGDQVVGTGAGDVGEIGHPVAIAVSQTDVGIGGQDLVVVDHRRASVELRVEPCDDVVRLTGDRPLADRVTAGDQLFSGGAPQGVGQPEGVHRLVHQRVRQAMCQVVVERVGTGSATGGRDDLVGECQGRFVVVVSGSGEQVLAGCDPKQARRATDQPAGGSDGRRGDFHHEIVGVVLSVAVEPGHPRVVVTQGVDDVQEARGSDPDHLEVERVEFALHDRQHRILQCECVGAVDHRVAVEVVLHGIEVELIGVTQTTPSLEIRTGPEAVGTGAVDVAEVLDGCREAGGRQCGAEVDIEHGCQQGA